MEKKQIRAAIYCRVGNPDQLSLETQKEQLCRYAKECGYNNLEVYMDMGFSGLNYDRPSFSKLEADIQSGYIGAVIVKNLDRIGRSIFETARWMEWVRKNGVKLYTADVPFKENPFKDLGCFIT